MPTFKVTKTLTIKAKIIKTINAKRELDAEVAAALSIKDSDWEFVNELESNTIKTKL